MGHTSSSSASMSNRVSVRLDKWLYFSRLIGSRTKAEEIIIQGKIRVNRIKVLKPSHLVKVGDVVTAHLNSGIKIIKIRGIVARRIASKFAKDLFEDLTDRLISI